MRMKKKMPKLYVSDVLKEKRPYYLDYQTRRRAFTGSECDQIIKIAKKEKTQKSLMEWGKDNQFIRDTNIHWVYPTESNRWIFDKISNISAKINNELFNFALDGQIPSLQIGEYSTGQGYDWHCDMGAAAISRRKLSVAVQLSSTNSYKGGDLQFFRNIDSYADAPRERGTMTLFPSWQVHRVTPVTEGKRWSLVVWLEGSPFR